MVAKSIEKIPPSGIRRFFDLILEMEDVISLGVGEPDFATPWHIRESAVYSIEKGETTYTSNAGLIELREKIGEALADSYNLCYDPKDQILITTGVSEGLDLALRAVVDPGDEVLVIEPAYVSYKPCIILAGGVPVVVETAEDARFKVRPEQIKEKITKKTKALILCYPNNPTGMSYTEDELAEIAKVCEDVVVISDEIYGLLSYEMTHIPFAHFRKENTILLSGFSKGYAMTGWRIGYAAGPSEIVSAMCKIHQYTMLCAPIMSQKAALAALAGNTDSEMRDSYKRRRMLITEGLNSIGLTCLLPDGAFYVFCSVKNTGLSSFDFAEKLLFSQKVAVVPGNVFGECGEGYIRCSYATSEDRIEEALIRMERFLKSLR